VLAVPFNDSEVSVVSRPVVHWSSSRTGPRPPPGGDLAGEPVRSDHVVGVQLWLVVRCTTTVA